MRLFGYWLRIGVEADHARIVELTTERREVIVASIPELAVR